MNCYYCDQVRPGGTNFGRNPAIGICQHCGVGVCPNHSHKGVNPTDPLLCSGCAEALSQTETRQPAAKTLARLQASLS